MELTISDVAPAATSDFEQLKTGLNGYNESQAGTYLREPVSIFIHDPQGKVLGGIMGEIKWGWLYVFGLWVERSLRGQDYGTMLLTKLERYAQNQEIMHVHLETASFQALGFYQKQGYEIFGTLEDMPVGHTSYYLKKTLKG